MPESLPLRRFADAAACCGGVAVLMAVLGANPAQAQGQTQAQDTPAKPVAVTATPAASPPILVRTGDHDDYGRLVFDMPPGTTVATHQQGDVLVVRFTPPGPLKVAGPPPRNVRAVTVDMGEADLLLAAGVKLRLINLDMKLVVDALDPKGTPATAPAAPAAPAGPTPSGPAPAKAAAAQAPAATMTEGPMCVEDASIADLQAALAAGRTTVTALTRAYLARIDAYDRNGQKLNAVREVNPEALDIAAKIDAMPPQARPPLAGMPILLKDNIATADHLHTSAGSLALADAGSRRDATLVAKLRRAGAVILGKANMTEFGNMLAVDMPSGYSSLGGQVRNPYAPALGAKGVPVVSPGGSSSGSAVAVAAGLAAAAIGTETSGSLLSPASQEGVVTVKPTAGLISRAGLIPIAVSQDTAGPMTRTVQDAAILLNVLAGPDPMDPMTARAPTVPDFTKGLDKDGLKGVRIGVPSDPADPADDVFYRRLTPGQAAVMDAAIKALQDNGAEIVRANISTEGWIGGAGTEMAILNRNPESPGMYRVVREPLVLVYELKYGVNHYLRDWATGTAMHNLGEIIGFNAAHADRALRFGQDLFLAAEAVGGTLQEPEYLAARQMDLRSARGAGLDAYMDENKLDAVLFPGAAGSGIAAKAGYPSVQVPAGFIADAAGAPEYPFGATFTGRAWSEAKLLRIAYAFEQATQARRMPPEVDALDEACRQ